MHGHLGVVGAWAVLTEQLDDALLSVPGRAQRVAECRGGLEIGDRIERFAAQAAEVRDDVGALTNVLFVCIGNSGRSMMAEYLFRADSEGGHEARSAGAAPGPAPEPTVVEALAELGIDASGHVPQKLTDDLIAWADVIVAACDGVCPVVPGKPYFNWNLPDPYGRPLDEVRPLRDDVRARVDALLRRTL